MLLYKYQSMGNIAHLVDLIHNRKLYCAKYSELNDPWEGRYCESILYSEYNRSTGITSQSSDIVLKTVDSIVGNSRIRVSSLSTDFKNTLLWAYYADSHKGICVEYDFPDRMIACDRKPEINKINRVFYNDLPILSNTILDDMGDFVSAKISDPRLALRILTNKTKAWEKENEYRFLARKKQICTSQFQKRIFVGINADDETKVLISKLVTDIPIISLSLSCHGEWKETHIR